MKLCVTVVTVHVRGSGLILLRKRAPEGKATTGKKAAKRAGADGARTAKENGLSPPRYLKKCSKQKNSRQLNSPNTTI
jgi:hypothetical protein